MNVLHQLGAAGQPRPVPYKSTSIKINCLPLGTYSSICRESYGDNRGGVPYRGTSTIRNRLPLGTYRSMCRGPYGGLKGRGGVFL